MTAWKAFMKNTALGKLTLMIYIFLFLLVFVGIALRVMYWRGIKDEQLSMEREIEAQKRDDGIRWASKIINECFKIESE